MKKIIFAFLGVALIWATLTLVGCEHEHEWGEWKTTKEATCTAEGTMERICECGEKETKSIDKIMHTNGSWIIDKEATCTEKGFKHLECTVCKETTVSGSIPATGHADGEWIVDAEATCTADGSKHQVCSVCETSIKTEAIAATGHTDGEWIVDAEATCTADGSKHQVCSVCEASIKTETIAAVGHNYTETITKATAEHKASVKFDCKVCNESHTEDFDSITVYVSLIGSGMTMTGGGMYYTRSFEVTAFGGYGEYQYKFESGSNLLQDYSTSNEVEVYGNIFVDSATITITVKDELGQKTVYQIKGNGSYVDSYVIYE